MEAKRLSYKEADLFQYYLEELPQVTKAVVYERTADAVICYQGERSTLLKKVAAYRCKDVKVPDGILEHSGRELNSQYQEKLVNKVLFHYGRKVFLPAPIAAAYTGFCSIKYIWKGIQTLAKGKIEVPVLDGTAIGVSVLRGDTATAGSIMFLLGIGELLEEWTHKKSVDDLARTMSLNVDKVWIKEASGQEVLVSASRIRENDQIVVHMGNVVPFDGTVSDGEAMLNQASLTGESAPVRKTAGNTVFAGTVVEEGEITVLVRKAGGSSRYEKIAAMIEESEKLKSGLESKAEHLADKLVPYTFAGTALTWLFTRNVTKALSVLMVDFSCALKLAMPVSVLSAIREAGSFKITVKGGKFLEAVAEADTIVFDKTGTLTEGRPSVTEWIDVVPPSDGLYDAVYSAEMKSEHPLASAVTAYLAGRGARRREVDSFESLTGRGIAFRCDGASYWIGSRALLETRDVRPSVELLARIDRLEQEGAGTVFVGQDDRLLSVVVVSDPLKETTREALEQLRRRHIRLVMLTGDNRRAAAALAGRLGIDDFRAEMMPDDKEQYVRRLQAEGRRVAMTGDGINDSQALARADVSIAMGRGTDVAMDVAMITLMNSDLSLLPKAYALSRSTVRLIRENLFWAFVYNLIGIPIAAGALYPLCGLLLSPMLAGAAMAFSSVSVVANSLRLKWKKL